MPLKLIFAGTPEFAVPTLEALLASSHTITAVYTQPDRPAGRGRHLTASPVKQLALNYNLPVFQPISLKDQDEQNRLAQLQADVMIVVAYGLLLPSAVLAIPRFGCINVHASLLPRWRGAAPIQRALLAGDSETGVTIMQMDKGLDTGAMLQRVSCSIDATATSATLHHQLAELGAQALLNTLTKLEQGSLNPVAQDATQACYANKMTKEEAKLNWLQSAISLERQVRAFNPWPVAYCQLEQEIVRIWQAQALTPNDESAPPGTLVAINKDSLDVATTEGVLRLLEIQLPGMRRLAVKDFLNAPRNALIPGKTQFT